MEPLPKLLAAIPQCPLDPASGAARSAREVCELLAAHGWQVTFAAFSCTEGGHSVNAADLEQQYGITSVTSHPDEGLSFTYRRVTYRLLDTGPFAINQARVAFASRFDALVQSACSPLPDILLTYGSSEDEVRRRARLRALGVKVVFFLRNFSYVHPRSFAEVDAILTPSRMLSDHYRGIPSTALPHVLALEDIVAPVREPVFYTFINPAPGKGLDLFLSIVGRAAELRPDLPFLAVESRGSEERIANECARMGIPLERLNLHIARNTPQPHRVYAVTRVLLVPSTEPEAGPRVIPEAHLNGIPVIASDRCAFAQSSEDFPGFVPRAGEDDAARVSSWLERITSLHDDDELYQRASREAWQAGEPFRLGATAQSYLDFFARLKRSP